MNTRTKVTVGLIVGLVIGIVIVWGGFGPRAARGPTAVGAVHLPAPESLGVVLPPEPTRSQREAPSTVPAGKTNRGLTPPPEETRRLERDGAVLY